MQEVIGTLVNVLILSSMYILVALGFVFLFSMLGIFNLAHGAIYMVGGYFGYLLIAGLGIQPWLALVLSTLVVAAFGMFLEKFCFRPFVGNFNRLVMICVAITMVLQTSVNIMAGTKIVSIPSFAKGVLKAGLVTVSYERILMFSLGLFLLLAAIWFVNRTRWGQQMQAIAQNGEGALLQGINVHGISAMACALGCGLAALAGCLLGAYLRLGPFMGDFMLLKVLIIAMLAGVGSIGGVFVTGLIVSCLDAVLPVLLNGALSDAISVTIVVIILLFRPKGFFGHEAEVMSESPASEDTEASFSINARKWVAPAFYVVVVAVAALLPALLHSPYMVHILTLSFVYVIASVSLRTITISGQFPLAHGAFMGIGAYLSAMASKWLGLSPWIAMPLAGFVSMGLGILTGYPFARLRTLYYAMGSLFFGVGVLQIIYAGGIYTGGYAGLAGIPPLFATSRISYYYFFLGLAIATIIALYRFEFSRIGASLKAVSQSHLVASSVGINEGYYRILCVSIGCFFVGLAGAGYAHYNLVISGSSFNLSATLWIVMYVLIGGVDSFAGPIIGTFVLILIPEFFRDLKMYSPYISSGILLIVVYLMPKGLVGLPNVLVASVRKRREERKIAYASSD